ncbi:MAG: DUF4184 family protein [bacterium]
MPFTLSHVAVAAPLARLGLIMSALVVGSMAPDFLYYLRLSTNNNWGHSPEGIVFFTLPLALFVLWGFHAFIKRPLLYLVPLAHRRRLVPYAGHFGFWPLKRFFLILISVVIGILIHLLLDSFTHDYGLLAERLPFLREPVLQVYGRAMPLCDLLQFVMSFGLLLVLVTQYVRWFFLNRTGASLATFLDFRTHLPLYVVLLLIATISAVLYANYSIPIVSDLRTLRLFAGRLILFQMSALVLEILILIAYRNRVRL